MLATLTRRRLLSCLSGAAAAMLPGTALGAASPHQEVSAVPADIPDYQGPGAAQQSVSDPLNFLSVIDHRRYQLVATPEYEYTSGQWGRVLLHDDMENPAVQWQQVAGTVATDATVALRGLRSLKLTSVAGVGGQAIARKTTQLVADQSVSTFPLVVYEAWLKPFDTNLRDLQLIVRPDDSLVRYQAGLRFHVQQAAVAQMNIQYLDSTGTYVTAANYPIRQGGGNVGDCWHHLLFALNYKQGNGGYLTYALLKFDDATVKPSPPPSAQVLATAGLRETSWDVLATCDTAAVSTVVNLDEVFAGDLSNVFQL